MSDNLTCRNCGREFRSAHDYVLDEKWRAVCIGGCAEPLFVKGQRVCAKAPYQAQWRVGIITDVFLAPVTQQYVYVIGGEGYYADEVEAFEQTPEPQSLRA